MQLWHELRRRSIFKVGIAYLVTAWLLVQVTSAVFPQVRLPDWAPTLVTMLLAIGFPVALLLAWAYEMTPEGIRRTETTAGTAATGAPFNRSQNLNFWMTSIVGLAVLFMAVDNYWLRGARGSAENADAFMANEVPLSFEIEAPSGSRFTLPTMEPHPALSADGRSLVFAAPTAASARSGLTETRQRVLWVQTIGELEARPLPGSANASFPFWSQDGRFIAFASRRGGDTTLYRMSVTGAAPDPIVDVDGYFGGSWSADDTIVYSTSDGIHGVSARGGEPARVTQVANGEPDFAHRFPEFLPDGRRFIYLIVHPEEPDLQGIYLGSLDSEPGERRRLTASDSQGTLATGPDGRTYLFYVRNRALIAQPFDPESGELSGEARRVASPIEPGQGGRFAPFAASNRALVYRPGNMPDSTLTWFNRSGTPMGTIDVGASAVSYPALSRDGSKLVLVRHSEETDSVWWFDLERGGIGERLTPESRAYTGTQWSNDDQVYYTRFDSEGGWDIFSRSLAAQQAEVPVYVAGDYSLIKDITDDGRYVIFQGSQAATVGAMGEAFVIIQSASSVNQSNASINHGRVSPDGRWFAYSSSVAGGRNEVYVTSFPIAGDPERVSIAGGSDPQWRADGNELYFVSEDRVLMAVEMSSGEPVDEPESLFRIEPEPYSIAFGSAYSPMPDGQSFLVNESIDADPVRLMAMWNWQFGQ